MTGLSTWTYISLQSQTYLSRTGGTCAPESGLRSARHWLHATHDPAAKEGDVLDRAHQLDGPTSLFAVGFPLLRVSTTSRARWPAYGAPGHRANEEAIVSTCSFLTARLRRGRSTSASTALAAHSSPETVNAPVNPCVSATGSAAPPWSALVIRVVATVERIASPSDPPTSWVALSSPEARPESSLANRSSSIDEYQ
jgi:hypothetical protein